MPFLVTSDGRDDRSVSKEFVPEIDIDLFRMLAGTRELPSGSKASLPQKLRISMPRRGGIPHILGWHTGPWIISKRVREILEELEPDHHEFFRLQLLNDQGKFIVEYYLMLPPPSLAAIDFEKTDWLDRNKIGYFAHSGRITLRGDIIAGHHFWRGNGPQMSLEYFCSDQLHDRLASESLDGLRFSRRCEVVSGNLN